MRKEVKAVESDADAKLLCIPKPSRKGAVGIGNDSTVFSIDSHYGDIIE